MSQSATPTNRLFEVRLVETIRSHAYVLAPTHEAAGRLTPSQAHTLKRKAIFTGRTLKIASDPLPETVAAGDELDVQLSPFGDFPGLLEGQRVIQTCDRAAERVAETLPPEGIPVYVGHPDVPELAGRYPDKGAKGWVTAVEPGEEGAILRVDWLDKPAAGAFKWFSPYWIGELGAPEADGTVRMDIAKIASIGLVNNPRIPDFAFACELDPQTSPNQPQGIRMDKTKLAVLLGLPEDSGEEQILEAIAALKATAEAAEAQVDAANTDLEAAKAEAEEEKKACEEVKAELANARADHAELLLANALSDGRVTPATAPTWRANLRRDFARYSRALANERPQVPTASRFAGRPAAPAKSLRALANEIAKEEGISFDAAWLKAKSANPARFRAAK